MLQTHGRGRAFSRRFSVGWKGLVVLVRIWMLTVFTNVCQYMQKLQLQLPSALWLHPEIAFLQAPYTRLTNLSSCSIHSKHTDFRLWLSWCHSIRESTIHLIPAFLGSVFLFFHYLNTLVKPGNMHIENDEDYS